MTGRNESQLAMELREVLNKHCAENGCNTPDYMLAGFLMDCLKAFDCTVNARERWYGREVRRLPGPFDTPFDLPTANPQGKEP